MPTPKKLTKAQIKKKEHRLLKRQKKQALSDWTIKVKERDNFICQICEKDYKEKPKGLHAHHILDKKNFKMFSTDINNGISLCYWCHKTGPKAAHLNSLFFANWLKINKPEQYIYITKKLAELWS